MTFSDWITEPANWAFLAVALPIVIAGFRVVTSRNVVHAALFLVLALAASAGLFILLSAEFVAWVLVLVYIGAVIVLFLFGIMITRAPIGRETDLSHASSWPAAVVAAAMFALMTSLIVAAADQIEGFADPLPGIGSPTATEVLGEGIITQYLIPFEAVGFILLAALIGGITLARKDLTPAEEAERQAV
jgi:NADH-quinone oxidoreductase subunit J